MSHRSLSYIKCVIAAKMYQILYNGKILIFVFVFYIFHLLRQETRILTTLFFLSQAQCTWEGEPGNVVGEYIERVEEPSAVYCQERCESISACKSIDYG